MGVSSSKATVWPLLEPIQTTRLSSRRLPHGFQESEVESFALAAFLEDYCVVSTNRVLSRGYLDGLESILAQADPSCDVAQASKIMALVNFGNRWHRPALVHKARVIYSALLSSFRKTMSNNSTSRTIQSLLTAVLLGLYEVRLDIVISRF